MRARPRRDGGGENDRPPRPGGRVRQRGGREHARIGLLDGGLLHRLLRAREHGLEQAARGFRLALDRAHLDLRLARLDELGLGARLGFLEALDPELRRPHIGLEGACHAADLGADGAEHAVELGLLALHVGVTVTELGTELGEFGPRRGLPLAHAGDGARADDGGQRLEIGRAARRPCLGEPAFLRREVGARGQQVGLQAGDLLVEQVRTGATHEAGLCAHLLDPVLGVEHLLAELRHPCLEPAGRAPHGLELLLELVVDVELGQQVRGGLGDGWAFRSEADVDDAGVGHDRGVDPRQRGEDDTEADILGLRLPPRRWGEPGREIGRDDSGGPGGLRPHPALRTGHVRGLCDRPVELGPAGEIEPVSQPLGHGEGADDLELALQHDGGRSSLVAHDALQLADLEFLRLVDDRRGPGVAGRELGECDERKHGEEDQCRDHRPFAATDDREQRSRAQPADGLDLLGIAVGGGASAIAPGQGLCRLVQHRRHSGLTSCRLARDGRPGLRQKERPAKRRASHAAPSHRQRPHTMSARALP